MTREEKQKAIDALKKSAPVMAMTQEEFNDYIQTLNKVMDWLEQEPKSEWEHDHEILKSYSNGANEVLDKIRAEIEDWQTDIHDNEHDAESYDFVFERIYEIIDKYRAESEE